MPRIFRRRRRQRGSRAFELQYVSDVCLLDSLPLTLVVIQRIEGFHEEIGAATRDVNQWALLAEPEA
jgi:hypothetical protein